MPSGARAAVVLANVVGSEGDAAAEFDVDRSDITDSADTSRDSPAATAGLEGGADAASTAHDAATESEAESDGADSSEGSTDGGAVIVPQPKSKGLVNRVEEAEQTLRFANLFAAGKMNFPPRVEGAGDAMRIEIQVTGEDGLPCMRFLTLSEAIAERRENSLLHTDWQPMEIVNRCVEKGPGALDSLMKEAPKWVVKRARLERRRAQRLAAVPIAEQQLADARYELAMARAAAAGKCAKVAAKGSKQSARKRVAVGRLSGSASVSAGKGTAVATTRRVRALARAPGGGGAASRQRAGITGMAGSSSARARRRARGDSAGSSTADSSHDSSASSAAGDSDGDHSSEDEDVPRDPWDRVLRVSEKVKALCGNVYCWALIDGITARDDSYDVSVRFEGSRGEATVPIEDSKSPHPARKKSASSSAGAGVSALSSAQQALRWLSDNAGDGDSAYDSTPESADPSESEGGVSAGSDSEGGDRQPALTLAPAAGAGARRQQHSGYADGDGSSSAGARTSQAAAAVAATRKRRRAANTEHTVERAVSQSLLHSCVAAGASYDAGGSRTAIVSTGSRNAAVASSIVTDCTSGYTGSTAPLPRGAASCADTGSPQRSSAASSSAAASLPAALPADPLRVRDALACGEAMFGGGGASSAVRRATASAATSGSSAIAASRATAALASCLGSPAVTALGAGVLRMDVDGHNAARGSSALRLPHDPAGGRSAASLADSASSLAVRDLTVGNAPAFSAAGGGATADPAAASSHATSHTMSLSGIGAPALGLGIGEASAGAVASSAAAAGGSSAGVSGSAAISSSGKAASVELPARKPGPASEAREVAVARVRDRLNLLHQQMAENSSAAASISDCASMEAADEDVLKVAKQVNAFERRLAAESAVGLTAISTLQGVVESLLSRAAQMQAGELCVLRKRIRTYAAAAASFCAPADGEAAKVSSSAAFELAERTAIKAQRHRLQTLLQELQVLSAAAKAVDASAAATADAAFGKHVECVSAFERELADVGAAVATSSASSASASFSSSPLGGATAFSAVESMVAALLARGEDVGDDELLLLPSRICRYAAIAATIGGIGSSSSAPTFSDAEAAATAMVQARLASLLARVCDRGAAAKAAVGDAIGAADAALFSGAVRAAKFEHAAGGAAGSSVPSGAAAPEPHASTVADELHAVMEALNAAAESMMPDDDVLGHIERIDKYEAVIAEIKTLTAAAAAAAAGSSV